VSAGITWSATAQSDLLALFDWIAERAGIEVGEDYTTRIEAFATALIDNPRRGSPRDELQKGLRSIVYRRRTILFYHVRGTAIEIIHIAHGGRDVARLFADDD
jgi:toxin ParE1/3/4